MTLPTPDSTGSLLKRDFDQVTSAMQRARAVSVAEKANLAAGDTAIREIIDRIYKPFTRSTASGGFWNTIQDLSAGAHFKNFYSAQLSKRISFDPIDDVNLANNQITLDGNKLDIDEKIVIEGPGTPPGGLVKGTNYWVKAKVGQQITFAATLGGAEIDLVAPKGSGLCFVDARLAADFTTLITALEAVIDEIIVEVPVAAITLELLFVTFDKALASSVDGLAEKVLTSVQTATLQTKLQDVVDAIDAPL